MHSAFKILQPGNTRLETIGNAEVHNVKQGILLKCDAKTKPVKYSYKNEGRLCVSVEKKDSTRINNED